MTIDPTTGLLLLAGVDIMLCVVLVVTIVIVHRHERETRAALGSVLRPMNHVFYGNTDIRLNPKLGSGSIDTHTGDARPNEKTIQEIFNKAGLDGFVRSREEINAMIPPQPALVRTENVGPIITHRPRDDLYWAMVNDGLIQHTPGAVELDPVLNAERN